jgi:hypothetical protein
MAPTNGDLGIPSPRVAPPSLALPDCGKGLDMAKKREQEVPEELAESELEEQNGEPLPDREAMSVVNPPFVSPPGITLPIEPPDSR